MSMSNETFEQAVAECVDMAEGNAHTAVDQRFEYETDDDAFAAYAVNVLDTMEEHRFRFDGSVVGREDAVAAFRREFDRVRSTDRRLRESEASDEARKAYRKTGVAQREVLTDLVYNRRYGMTEQGMRERSHPKRVLSALTGRGLVRVSNEGEWRYYPTDLGIEVMRIAVW